MYIKVVAVLPFLFLFTFLAWAENEKITGLHLENELTCSSCHLTDTPVKRAGQQACIDCHGDMQDDHNVVVLKNVSGYETKSTIHTSHAGQIRCTLCHSMHKPSVLYCNEGCHHTWQINVP